MKSFSKLLLTIALGATASTASPAGDSKNPMDENPALTGGPTGDYNLEAPKNPVEDPATSGRALNDTELAKQAPEAPAKRLRTCLWSSL